MGGLDDQDDGQGTPQVGSTRSEVSGYAQNVVQARDISGGVHYHGADQQHVVVPRQLPPAIRDFTGRTEDIAALDALLPPGSTSAGGEAERFPAVVITAIDGTAGIGKTTLAVTWAHRVSNRFPDGTLYTNLRGYGPGRAAKPGEVLDGFLRAMGVPATRIPTDLEERAALYRTVLDARRVLVILDNANAADQVRPLLPAGAGCLALITSRSNLMGLVIGQGAVRISLDLLTPSEAVSLLRRIVGAARADAQPQVLARLAEACARLPLALRVAGQRAAARPRLGLVDVLAELADRRYRLDALSSTNDEVTAVRTVFDWSYDALPSDHARVFRALGLHPGVEIDVHAAAALAEVTLAQCRRALEALADVHLAELTGRDRYRTHDLLRAYAAERAESDESAENRFAAIERLLGFYLHAAEAGRSALDLAHHNITAALPMPREPLTFGTSIQALDWFKLEYPNLIAVSHYAFENGLFLVSLQISGSLGGLFDYIGRRDEWVRLFENALAAARTLGDQAAEGLAHDGLGVIFYSLRSYEQSADHHAQALELARTDGHQFGEARALNGLGNALRDLDRYREAEHCYRRAIDIYHELGLTTSAAVSLANVGLVYHDQQRDSEALELYSRASEIFLQKNDQPHQSWILEAIGDAHFALGHIDDALYHHRSALDIARRLGLGRQEARILASLGDVLHHQGDRDAAQACWSEAATIYDATGDGRADELRARL